MSIDLIKARDEIGENIDSQRDKYSNISDCIWRYAELSLEEYKSSKLLADTLTDAGFKVEFGTDKIETAFTATYGSGCPVIAMVAEYDALPGLSQEMANSNHSPVVEGGAGHGCGHNVMGTAIVAAGIAAKCYMEKHNIPGTLRVIGTPAEETIGTKTFMVRDGIFDDVDACIGYHSASFNAVVTFRTMAVMAVYYSFHGKAAHAGSAPHLGRSALDACELMNVGVNYLREHVKQETRIHYAYEDAGKKAPNIVHPYACLKYYIRSENAADLHAVYERINDIARGAALMTGTRCEIETINGMSNFVVNSHLSKLCADSMMMFGEPDFDEKDEALAKEFFDSFSEEQKDAGMLRLNFTYENAEALRSVPLIRKVAPYRPSDGMIGGATDLGDVSNVVPTVHFHTACYANGTPGHNWQQTAQTGSSISHKALAFAAKGMALSAIRMIDSPELLEMAKEELQRTTGGKYVSPLAPDQKIIKR